MTPGLSAAPVACKRFCSYAGSFIGLLYTRDLAEYESPNQESAHAGNRSHFVVEQEIQAQIEELAAPRLPKRKGAKIKTSHNAEFVALTFTRSP
jgi:hypothetical protein